MTTDGLQTQASYTCDVGYTLSGYQTITCRGDGTWDFSEPQCGTNLTHYKAALVSPADTSEKKLRKKNSQIDK